jgi:hypothetical protein
MTTDTNETTSLLLLRDSAGNFYALSEDAIRACRATAEQQQALRQAIGDQDVVGYAGGAGGGLVAIGAITIAPQINTNIGFNIAAANFAPVTQVLGQTGLNAFTGLAR